MGCMYALSRIIPSLASLSILGVRISSLCQETSLYPVDGNILIVINCYYICELELYPIHQPKSQLYVAASLLLCQQRLLTQSQTKQLLP